jgi:hypothetical protein
VVRGGAESVYRGEKRIEKLIIGVYYFEEETHARTEVLRKFANLVHKRCHNLTVTVCSPPTEECIPKTEDFSLTIDIVSLTIGITTEGGTNNANTDQLEDFKNKGCDLILCTSLSTSDTKATEAIEKFAKTNKYKPI